jgi:hypothetical protein
MKHPLSKLTALTSSTPALCAGCVRNGMDGAPVVGDKVWGLLILLFGGLVLYLTLSGVIALVSRRDRRRGASFDLASQRVPPDAENDPSASVGAPRG